MYVLSTITRAWRTLIEKNRARRQFRGMDDHMLRDIGIRRDSIDQFVAGTQHTSHYYS